jgi:hypothetical protein
MDFVTTLRRLWLRRLFLIPVVLLSVAAGAYLTVGTPAKDVGIGQASALVDTTTSQVVDLGGQTQLLGIATLPARATLLAGLMTSSPMKDQIATRAGISPRLLIGESAATTSSGSGSSTGPTTFGPDAYVLTAGVPELSTGQLPIIAVNTQAPTTAEAVKLANSSMQVLSEYLQNLAQKDNVPDQSRLVLRQLGPATAGSTSLGSSKLTAVVAAAAILLLGCALILGVPALKAGWRRAGELEKLPPGELERLSAGDLEELPAAARIPAAGMPAAAVHNRDASPRGSISDISFPRSVDTNWPHNPASTEDAEPPLPPRAEWLMRRLNSPRSAPIEPRAASQHERS